METRAQHEEKDDHSDCVYLKMNNTQLLTSFYFIDY